MNSARPSRGIWVRALAATAALGALVAVFLAYLDPHLAVDVASRLWSCF